MPTFINSLLIPALALALLPIVIHLMNRKKTRLILFSSLDFLKALQRNKMKRLKVRQILLLLLRSAILLLAVLAFMRPVSVVSDRGDIAAHHATSVILIIDNSMSAGLVSDQGAVIDRIKKKAADIMEFMKEGDEALLISADGETSPQFSRNFSELRARISSLSVRPVSMDLTDALHRAATLMESARHPNREIYVLSDLQANAFEKEPLAILSEASLVPVLVSFSSEHVGNSSVRKAAVTSRILEQQKPLKVEVTLRQDGPSRGDGLLTMYLDGRRSGQLPVSMENGPDEKNHTFTVTAPRSGYVTGYAEMDDDPLMPDNRYYFHAYIPEAVRVLLVGTGPETEILRLALSPTGDGTSSVRVIRTTPAQFLTVNDSEYDVAIFYNMPTFSDAVLQRVEAFVRRGGGLMVFPGPALQMDDYNSGLMTRLGIGRMAGRAVHSKDVLSFDRVDAAYPVIGGLFESPMKEVKIESPAVIQSVKVLPGTSAVVPITLSDRTPFLLETRLDRGTVMFFCTSVNLEWSDLALKGLFPAMLHRGVRYLASSGVDETGPFRTGEPIEFRQKNVSSENLRVTGPSGNEIRPRVRLVGTEAVLELPALHEPGSYWVWHRDDPVRVFDVNMPEKESEVTPILKDDLDLALGADGYRFISETEKIEEFILQSRYGREWWRWLLAGALILALVEIGVAQSHRFVLRAIVKETR